MHALSASAARFYDPTAWIPEEWMLRLRVCTYHGPMSVVQKCFVKSKHGDMTSGKLLSKICQTLVIES